MKPNKLQQSIIDLCKGQLDFWKDTNDLSSPTHSSDMDNEFAKFIIDNKIEPDKLELIHDTMETLLTQIRDLN